MEISNLEKVLILPGVSGNMSMLYDRLMCINYNYVSWLLSHDNTRKRIYIGPNVNINSTLKWNVLNHEHRPYLLSHTGTTIHLTRQLCSVRSGIMSIHPEKAP